MKQQKCRLCNKYIEHQTENQIYCNGCMSFIEVDEKVMEGIELKKEVMKK